MRARKPSSAGMIDLHCHILPMIDDGAQSLAEALEMARLACEDGVVQVVATPHDTGRDERWRGAREGVRALQEELTRREIPLQVLAGLEIRIDLDTHQQIRDERYLTLNDSHYLLIELPFDYYPLYVEHVIFELLLAGYTPILAHPERSSFLEDDPMKLFRLVQRGALVQVTTTSISGDFGAGIRNFTRLLLEHGLVHIIASDAHGAALRPPVLSQAVETAAQWIGEQRATAMVTAAPEAIVNDQRWEPEPPIEPQPERHWFRIRR